MQASGVFKVSRFVPTPITSEPLIETALPVGVAQMEKIFEGEVTGRSATLFTAAFDRAKGIGTYMAMESFEGSIRDRFGTFNFVHSAATTGTDRQNEFFAIVPYSGTGALTGITGAGGMRVDPDGVHRIWFDYELV
jgi:hypothetical protein